MDSSADFLEQLRRISTGLNPARGLHAGLKSLLGIMAQKPWCIRPHLVLFDPETRNLRLYVSESAPRASQIVYTPGMGVTGQVFSTGRPVIVECILGHPVFLCKFFERSTEEMRRLAFISVPVVSPDKQIIGTLNMDTPCALQDALQARCLYMEVIAGIIATHTACAGQNTPRERNARAKETISPSSFVTASKAMRTVADLAVQASATRRPVLLTGESGCGREYLAATIHAASERQDLPMVRFDCGGHSADAAERELFGYRKGAFPGATQTSKGVLELARSSTLFLASIENLPLNSQNGLLQALQEQKFSRVGGGQPLDLDIRLICSASPALEALVEEGRFSAELFSRLSGFSIAIPPLRERPEDILPLALEFLKPLSNAAGQPVERISDAARERLLQYPWPGNVRELRLCLEQAVRSCEDTTLQAGNLPAALYIAAETSPAEASFNDAVARFERELLTDALRRAHGNMLQAARALKTSYRIINYKIKKYGLEPRAFMLKNAPDAS